MNSKQVLRPIIPHRGGIPDGMREGKMIQIKGTIPFGADAFEVNLQTGYDSFSDRALHMSVRMDAYVVVRNHMERNMWGSEERTGPFPFAHGRVFTINILTEPSGYKIAVDGHHCWDFRHKIPIHRVSSLYIAGRVEVERIEYVDQASNYRPTTSYPAQPAVNPGLYPAVNPPAYIPSIPSIPPVPVCPMPSPYTVPGQMVIPPPEVCPQPYTHPKPDPIYNPKVPVTYMIPGGLRSGTMIHITGRPFLHPTKFNINLQTGTQAYPAPDIAFHMDVRFENHTLVRNSRLNNAWEREEKKKFSKSEFPFQAASNFNLTITVASNKFLVSIDGRQLCEFHHRLSPISRFNTLYIEKDIIVDSLWVS